VYLCLPGNYLIKYAAVTVARAKNTWNPTTAISATSPAESDNIRAQPAATLSTYYIPRTPKSSRRYHNATASAFDAVTVTKTMTVTIVSVVSAQEPANSADGYVTRLAALQDTTHHMNEIAIGLQDIISGQISGMISNTNSNAVHSGRNPDPPATASATNASNPTPPLADMAVLGYPGGTIVFLNNTSQRFGHSCQHARRQARQQDRCLAPIFRSARHPDFGVQGRQVHLRWGSEAPRPRRWSTGCTKRCNVTIHEPTTHASRGSTAAPLSPRCINLPAASLAWCYSKDAGTSFHQQSLRHTRRPQRSST
jgi:hypothetical protein